MPPIIPHYFKELITQKEESVPSIESTLPSEAPIETFLQTDPKDPAIETVLLAIEKLAAEHDFPSLYALSAEQIYQEFTKKQASLEKLFTLLKDKKFIGNLTNPAITLQVIQSIVEKWQSRNQAILFHTIEKFSPDMLEKDDRRIGHLLASASARNSDNWANVSDRQFEHIHDNRIATKVSKEMLANSEHLAEEIMKQIEILSEKFRPESSADKPSKPTPRD